MSTVEYLFDGMVKWAHLQSPNKKYGDYRLSFYPKDSDTRKAVKATGTMCGVKEDDDGFYYTFRSEIQPVITDGEGRPITALVGNNSKATIRITVEKFTSAKHGEIARTKLTGVAVTELVPFVPHGSTEQPTADAVTGQSFKVEVPA